MISQKTLRVQTIYWFASFVALLFSSTTIAQDWNAPDQFGGNTEPITVEAFFRVKPGTNLGKLYVEATLGDGYHVFSTTQSKNDEGMGPEKTVMTILENDVFKLIGGWEPHEKPHIVFDRSVNLDTEQFEGFVSWSAPIEFAPDVDFATEELEFKFKGQYCNEGGCDMEITNLVAAFDGDETTEIVRGEVPVAEEEPTKKKPVVADTPEEIEAMAKLYDPSQKINYVKLDGSSGKGTFWYALMGAFLGGVLLNLMPCVFPVLGLKVLGFVEQAGSDPAKIKMHGIAFAAGLVFSMWVLAGAILGIKASTGNEVSWGEQMGNPYFVGAIVIMLFVLGLNLAGVFEMGLFMTKVGGSGDKKKGYLGSFISGIITTLVATPCSGPFLGTAMGYTLQQDNLTAMFLFTIFGLGIALPYLILSFFPSLINMLPKPGAWMETFKKLMAFTLFAAAAFFVTSFGKQTGVDGLSWFLMALCVIALAAFFYGKWSPAYIKSPKRQVWGWLAPAIIVALGGWMFIQASQIVAPKIAQNDEWELWVPGKVESKLAMKKAVWVDYTADW
jgi:thiol:disulfide interchange protein DsbD